MRNVLLPSLLLLHALVFAAAAQADENSYDSGLQLNLDYQLDQQRPLPPGQKPGLPLSLETQSVPGPYPDSGYQIGHGWYRGDFYFSGYANIEVDAPLGEPAALKVDDLSLFVSGHLGKWVNPFLEAEISDHAVIQQGGGPRGNGYIVFERMYNDSMLTERDTLRIGKMLAPVGNWNLIHAAPLVPTNTRPITTYRGFSEYVSGVSWIHDPEDNAALDWQLYWQPGSEIPRRPRDVAPRRFRNILGGHINLPLGLLDKVGASLQHGKMIETGETFTLYGVNASKLFGKLRVEGEAISSNWSGAARRAHNQETGIFGLADYTFAPRWHGILEWERYQDHEANQPSRNILAGISYKPSNIVLKLEYVRQMGDAQHISTGWQASLSTLF